MAGDFEETEHRGSLSHPALLTYKLRLHHQLFQSRPHHVRCHKLSLPYHVPTTHISVQTMGVKDRSDEHDRSHN